jgi:hypothetical protein
MEINQSSNYDDWKVSRRGFCGHINLNTILPKLIADLALVKVDVPNPDMGGFLYDIYRHPIDNFYIKRVCICDGNCLSKCGRNKNKLSCDGHHVFIVSLNNTLNIDETNDYIIDFTYKQFIYSGGEEDSNIKAMKAMPDYLFIPYESYINYSDTARWRTNISEPCKFITNNSNVVDSIYKAKYLRYKNKYLKLKYK